MLKFSFQHKFEFLNTIKATEDISRTIFLVSIITLRILSSSQQEKKEEKTVTECLKESVRVWQ